MLLLELFESVKSVLTSICPDKFRSFLGQLVQGAGNLGTSFDELVIVVGETRKNSDIFYGFGNRVLLNYFNFGRVRLQSLRCDHMAQIVDLGLSKMALAWLEL